jgi:hypothetical protein
MTAGCTTTSVAVTELGMTTLVAVVVATVAMIYTMLSRAPLCRLQWAREMISKYITIPVVSQFEVFGAGCEDGVRVAGISARAGTLSPAVFLRLICPSEFLTAAY